MSPKQGKQPTASKKQAQAAKKLAKDGQLSHSAGPAAGPSEPAAAGASPEWSFTPDVLDTTIIALPLLNQMKEDGDPEKPYDIVIDLNLNYPGGREQAQARIWQVIDRLVKKHRLNARGMGVQARKTKFSKQYLFGRLPAKAIRELVREDRRVAGEKQTEHERQPAVHRIWPDFEVSIRTNQSLATVKADAARNAFSAFGGGHRVGGGRFRHRLEPPALPQA